MRDEDAFLPGIKPYKEDKWCPHCINKEWVVGAKFFKISFDVDLLCSRVKEWAWLILTGSGSKTIL